MLNDLLRCLKAATSPTAADADSLATFATVVNLDVSEELLLNVVAACTNVTYYACQPDAVVEEGIVRCMHVAATVGFLPCLSGGLLYSLACIFVCDFHLNGR